MGAQGKLKAQSELVIIVPCQEGEEKAFIERDDYLRSIALDNKGEIARSVLSPMRAKGLEFGRVVLYKFGACGVSEGHVDVMEKIGAKGSSRLDREETLGLEYFFNGAYVGASRAQRRLLVVDTDDGLREFWRFATDTGEISGLLTERRRTVWTEDDLHHMMRGDSSTWSEDRDDPKALADRFFDQGKIEQSPYLLQLARNQYAVLDDMDRSERCTAMIHDIEGEHLEAASAYERLGELEEAIRCYWEAKAYNKISETSVRDMGRFSMSPFVVAARFVTGKPVVDRATQFFKELAAISIERRRVQFNCSHWGEVVQTVVSALVGDPSEVAPISVETAGEVYRALSRMQREEGLTLEKTQELALLAFIAEDPVAALDVWKDVKRRPSEREPVFILRARAKTTPYPQRLRWYGKLGDDETVVAEYKAHSCTDLEDEYREVVINALVALEEYRSAADVLKAGGSWSDVRRFLMELSNSDAGKGTARAVLGTYLRKGVEKGEFRQVIEDVEPGKKDLPVLASLLSDEQLLLATEAALIKLLARSQALVDERADEKFVSGTVHTMAKKSASQLKDLVSPEEVGAALERAGRMDSALMFYESVFNEGRWGKDIGTRQNAQARWLKCKQRQAELDRKDERRRNQRLAEAKRMSSEWGINFPEEEFPVISAISPEEIDTLLGAVSIREEEKGVGVLPGTSTNNMPSESAADLKADDVKEREEVTVVEQDVLDAGKAEPSHDDKTTEYGAEPSSWPFLSRKTFGGRIEISCNCEGVNLKAKFLPLKRRVELVDESNDDLALIRVSDRVLESPDLQLTVVDNSTWKIEKWSLKVSLIKLAEDVTLVDLVSNDERRILCLAV